MTARIITTTALLLTNIGVCFSQNTPPVVTINGVSADTVNRVITVDFDLADADNDPLDVTAFLSADSGTTHLVEGLAVSGDVGFPVTPGNNKSLQISYTISNLANASKQPDPWSTVKIVATDRHSPNISDIIDQIDSSTVYADMQFLSTPRHHVGAPAGLELVKDSLESVFLQSGLQTSRLPFMYANNVPSENIKGRKPGVVEEHDVIIIDGHFDAVNNTPGADDNATAVAAVLAAARVLEPYHFKKSINFLGFDKEEQGLVGATHYVNNRIEDYENIEAVINGEMLGYYDTAQNAQQLPAGFANIFPDAVDSLNNEDYRGIFLFVVGNTQNSSDLSRRFDSIARLYVPDVRSLVINAPGLGVLTPDLRRSDHAVFWNAGIPALMITDGADTRNPHYHQPTDDLSTINVPYLVRNIKAMVATVAALAEPMSAGSAVSEHFQLATNLDLSTENRHPLSKFDVFPNPSNGLITLRFPPSLSAPFEVTVRGIGGKQLFQQTHNPNAASDVKIDLGQHASGVFFIEVRQGNDRFAKKIIIHEGHQH